ncbi:MAG: DUF2442 domain-containing protein [Clostridiales Family XIII bacterium]|jgi:hypothetical protein|nr:DUF2442 domain-containing protein [Clostridiales Family XIII bacterium]
MSQIKIIHIAPLTNYRVKIKYETGNEAIFDVKPYIKGSWYEQLLDKAYFKSVYITEDGSRFAWPGGQDIAPYELYEL